MSSQPGGEERPAGAGAPSEEELRAAYEAELSRVNVSDLLAQSTVTLLNVAARRLGPPAAPAGAAGGEAQGAAEGRDLEQVRDAIDAGRALLEILERRIPRETRPLRDALSQLQMAYAAEVRAAAAPEPAGGGDASQERGAPAQTPSAGETAQKPTGEGEEEGRRPGPAEASGRLWVPGR